MGRLTEQEVRMMSYVELLAAIKEVNRPPGGKESVRLIVQNCFLTERSRVLDVGCNTGYVSFEIAHLAKCWVTGVDISPTMIATAKGFARKDLCAKKINFKVADGMKLPFRKNTFDAVVSGGSTAFIPDKEKALSEYARVTKPWGFIGDINFFYRKAPPKRLLNRMNDAMGINIQPWDENYWLKMYRITGLEFYFFHKGEVTVPSGKEIRQYCDLMAGQIMATSRGRDLIKKRLSFLMSLFAENHKYLSYGVFVFRKRPQPEQVSLFGA